MKEVEKKVDKTTVEDLWEIVPNKYEAIVVISKEARRIARMAREKGEKLEMRPTLLAIKNFLDRKIKYRKVKREG